MQLSGGYQLREAEVGTDDEAVTSLIAGYMTWAHARLRDDYGVAEPPADLADIRESLAAYRRPAGSLLLAERDGRSVGVGAVRGLGEDVAEIKRMYVLPEARGHHVASRMLDTLTSEAFARGASLIRLDTCRFMTDAQALYRSRRFTEREPYEGTEIPPRLQHLWLFFERSADST
ncbi:MAG: GNAT family N-acetyltransferase [Candidatus Dormibacteria bacterium]